MSKCEDEGWGYCDIPLNASQKPVELFSKTEVEWFELESSPPSTDHSSGTEAPTVRSDQSTTGDPRSESKGLVVWMVLMSLVMLLLLVGMRKLVRLKSRQKPVIHLIGELPQSSNEIPASSDKERDLNEVGGLQVVLESSNDSSVINDPGNSEENKQYEMCLHKC